MYEWLGSPPRHTLNVVGEFHIIVPVLVFATATRGAERCAQKEGTRIYRGSLEGPSGTSESQVV